MEIYVRYDDGDNDINETETETIDVPPYIFENIENYQRDFFKWLFNKSNNHQYWRYLDGEKIYCEYDANAFVLWLNEKILNKSNEKAVMINGNDGMHSIATKVIYF